MEESKSQNIDTTKKVRNIEKNLEISSLSIPTKDQLENEDFPILHKKLVKNHEKLLKFFLENSFPYFGLHGTSKKSAEIIKSEAIAHLEIATFYKKEKTEEFLYKLYAAAEYVRLYTQRSKESREKAEKGSILVFFLEKEDKNITRPWEHLYGAGSAKFGLDLDDKNEIAYREKLIRSENLLFRSSGDFNIKQNLVGEISLQEYALLLEELNTKPMESLGRTIIQSRFLSQEIVYRVLKLLKK